MVVGHTDSESAQHFDSEKALTIFFIVLRTGFEPLVLEADALPIEPPRPRRTIFTVNVLGIA